MKSYSFLAVIIAYGILILFGCSSNPNYKIAYTINEKDLIPEGIAYSSTTDCFYLSSIMKTKILFFDAKSGKYKDFCFDSIFKMRYLGLLVDDERKHLWACGNISEGDKRYSSAVKFNIHDGTIIRTYSYPDTNAATYNDLAIDSKGNVYFTNTNFQTVYRIDGTTDSLILFYDGKEIEYPNGIAIDPTDKYLYIASTTQGVRVLDIEQRKVINKCDTVFSTGIDGLKFYKNSLIGVQNEVKSKSDVKILRFYLDEKGTEIIRHEVVDQNNLYFDIPTTLTIANDKIYCIANSQMSNINFRDYTIRNINKLTDTYILCYPIK